MAILSFALKLTSNLQTREGLPRFEGFGLLRAAPASGRSLRASRPEPASSLDLSFDVQPTTLD
jgi:hypothetical protein